MTTPATTVTQSSFNLEYRVSTRIASTPERIWARLTDAAAFPSWNSTVEEIKGTIAPGQKLAIKVPLAPGRTFSPKVTEFVPGERMVWSDGFAPMFQGKRVFTLAPQPDGTTEFVMAETFTGLMLPLIKGSLPDFRPAFDQYAADLKRAAESAGLPPV